MQENGFFGFAPGLMELIIIGLVFCLILVPVVLVVLYARRASSGRQGETGRVRCPQCAEWIMPEAIKCRFCGAAIDRLK